MVVDVMTDVTKMNRNRFLYVDFCQLGSQLLRHQAGVLIRSVRGSEARHGHSMNLISRDFQHVKGAHRHQQSQRGIEAAGNAENRMAASGMGETLL